MAICRLSVFWTSLTKFSWNQSAIPMVSGATGAFGGCVGGIDGRTARQQHGKRKERGGEEGPHCPFSM